MADTSATLTDEEKEQIIANALEKRAGRILLARAMVEPIRVKLGGKRPYDAILSDWLELRWAMLLDSYDDSVFGRFLNPKIKKVKKYAAQWLWVLYWKLVMYERKLDEKEKKRQAELKRWRQRKKDKEQDYAQDG